MATRAPIPLPVDVLDYIGTVFDKATARVVERMERQPNVHEESLDLAFIEAVASASGPHRTASDTVVDIDVHFVGGGWHFERWEVADVGMIVTFRRRGEILRTKIVLLQSKRLYPREAEFVESHGLARPGGFGYLVRPDAPDVVQPRLFRFDVDCCYRALQIGDQQWASIGAYEQGFGIPIHYLLYHPGKIPFEVTVPVSLPLRRPAAIEVGARVVPAVLVRATTTDRPRNYAPSFADLCDGKTAPGSGLRDFMVDEVLACREGYVPNDFWGDEGVNRIFNQRGAPIAAAILIDIDVPAEFNQ